MSAPDEVEQLQARLERERKARRQAEVIAERGMRELWDVNRDLQSGVRRRTASLQQLAGGIDLAHRARWKMLAASPPSASTGVPALVAGPSLVAPGLCSPHEVGDRVVERWQRPAAAAGLLLVVDVDAPDELEAPWSHLIAAAEILIALLVDHGGSGTLPVSIVGSTGSIALSFGGPPGSAAGMVGSPDLAAVETILAEVGGRLDLRPDPDGATDVVVTVDLAP